MTEGKSGNSALVKAGFTLLGVAVGAGLTLWADLHLQEKRYFEESRRKSYVEYTNAHAKLQEAERLKRQAEKLQDESEEMKKLGQKAEKLRSEWALETKAALKGVAIYGDESVIKALASYYGKHVVQQRKCSGSTEEWKDNVAVFSRMRKELLGDDNVTNAELAMIIFGCVLEEN